jgi:PhoPQ-activated pathogenicity-related protein
MSSFIFFLRFVTEAMSMLVNEGETVRLPCVVDRLEGFVLLWKQKVPVARDFRSAFFLSLQFTTIHEGQDVVKYLTPRYFI